MRYRRLLSGLVVVAVLPLMTRELHAVYDCENPYQGAERAACPTSTSVQKSQSRNLLIPQEWADAHSLETNDPPNPYYSQVQNTIADLENELDWGWSGEFKVQKMTLPAIKGDIGRYIGYGDTETDHIVGDPAVDGVSDWCTGTEGAHQSPNCPAETEAKWYVCLPCCANASPDNLRPPECEPGNPGGFSPDFSPDASCGDCRTESTGSPLLRAAPPEDAMKIYEVIDSYRKDYSAADLQVSLGDGGATGIPFSTPVYGLRRSFDDPVLKTGLWRWLAKVPGQEVIQESASCTPTPEPVAQTPVCFAETLSDKSETISVEGGGETVYESSISIGECATYAGGIFCQVAVKARGSRNLNVNTQLVDAIDYFEKSTAVIRNLLPLEAQEQAETNNPAANGRLNFSFQGKDYEGNWAVPLAGIHESLEDLLFQYITPPDWLK